MAKTSVKKKVSKQLIQQPYSTFEGKVIRKIIIVTLDPFGNSIADTIAGSKNFLIRAGNRVHVQSHVFTIRNLLLFRKNQLFDSLLVRESERLVRSQKYVRDVSFYVRATSQDSDSVDIFIRELDTWSIIPTGGASASRLSLGLTDRNFVGMGHEAQAGYTWNHSTGGEAYNLNYTIPNIYKTYINTVVHLDMGESGEFSKRFTVDRLFFSSLTKWAAGVSVTQQLRKTYIPLNDSFYVLQRFKLNAQDYWAGNAIQIFKGNTEKNRTTNFISAVRFLRIRYLEKPVEALDEHQSFADENFYLASIGISMRNYVQDKYIFRFGITEDVPIGKVFSLTGGYQEKNNLSRIYLGARFSFGDYYPWGYLSANIEYGSFFQASRSQQDIFSASAIYFTGLIEIGRWKFRQFVKPQVILGLNPYPFDTLTLNDGYGLSGFKSTSLSGTSRLLFTLQAQSYAPWDFIGFRFGPFLSCTLGMLGHPESGFKYSKMYTQIGIGVLIKNDYLVLNTFQISISFYPVMPDNGHGIFKFNSFRTTDFDLGDYDIGKPATVLFQ
ncbi:MAG: hypothetical protein K0B08_01330 [Bacteroidales bacterium]|nr:hypothetical protein [Bacteroidales bacterium]